MKRRFYASGPNNDKNIGLWQWVIRSIPAILFLFSSATNASSFNLEAYGMNADAVLTSSYYGSQSLHTDFQNSLSVNDARGQPVSQSTNGLSAGMLRMLLMRTGVFEINVTPDSHRLSSAATDVYFSFSANEKSGITLSMSRVESTVEAGFSCEQDLGRRYTTLQRPSLTIMGRVIPLPASPAANTRIDGSSFGMPGVVIFLNEQTGTPQQGFEVTALRISMNYRDGSTTANGEFVFGVSRGQLECSRSDLGLNGVANPSPAEVDSLMNYIFTITNPGPDVMSVVQLEDVLPLGVAYQAATATHGGSCSELLGVVNCVWDSIAPGTSPQVNIRVMPQLQGLVSNTATLTSVDVDLNVLNNVVVINTLVEPAASSTADLSLSLDMPQTVMLGQPVMATGSVVNLGPDNASGVRAFLYLPMTVTYLQSTEGGGSCALQDPQMYLCEWPNVANNTQAAFVMELVFDEAGTVDFNVLVESDLEDPNTANNQVLESIQVNPDTTSPELVISILSDVPSAAPGETVNWIIAVDNLGGSSAYDVVIYDEMSEDLILNSVMPSGDGLCEVDYPSLRCSWTEVPAGGAVEIDLGTQLVADPLGSEAGHDAWAYAEDVCPETGTECDYAFDVVVVNF